MAPFTALSLMPTGAQVCCYHNQPVHEIESLAQWWHSPVLVELRQKLRKGIYEGNCKTCMEANSFSARRMYDAYQGDTSSDTPPVEAIQLVNLDISNKCNLACRTCNSQLSTTYGSLGAKAGYAKNLGYNRLPIAIAQEVADLVPARVRIAGGEPLADPLFHEAVKLFKPETTLSLLTNGTIYRKEFFDDFCANPNNHIVVSLDGGRSLNNYIRVFSDFDKIVANIKQLRTDYPATTVSINFMISSLSIWGIGDFVDDMVQAFGGDVNELWVISNNTTFPVEYRVSQLSKSDKLRLLESQKDAVERIKKHVAAGSINPSAKFFRSIVHNLFRCVQDAMSIEYEPNTPPSVSIDRDRLMDLALRIKVRPILIER